MKGMESMNNILDWMEYAKAARQMVAEGCVLLKNDDIFNKDESVYS